MQIFVRSAADDSAAFLSFSYFHHDAVFSLIALACVVSNFSSEFSSGRAVAPECGRALPGLSL